MTRLGVGKEHGDRHREGTDKRNRKTNRAYVHLLVAGPGVVLAGWDRESEVGVEQVEVVPGEAAAHRADDLIDGGELSLILAFLKSAAAPVRSPPSKASFALSILFCMAPRGRLKATTPRAWLLALAHLCRAVDQLGGPTHHKLTTRRSNAAILTPGAQYCTGIGKRKVRHSRRR
jgi:hypothetical protein